MIDWACCMLYAPWIIPMAATYRSQSEQGKMEKTTLAQKCFPLPTAHMKHQAAGYGRASRRREQSHKVWYGRAEYFMAYVASRELEETRKNKSKFNI